MTLFLAIWGAVTGTVGTTVGVLLYLQDRAHIVVHARAQSSGDPARSAIMIWVANKGKRPTTIGAVGLLVAVEDPVPAELDDYVGVALIPREPYDPIERGTPLSPGESIEFLYPVGRRLLVPYYTPLRAYAADVLGNVTYDDARPFFESFTDLRWWPPDETDEVLLQPRPSGVRPKQPRPRWKVWKKRVDLLPRSLRYQALRD
jgi:hypothetical protein